jgi:hypothetical protein
MGTGRHCGEPEAFWGGWAGGLSSIAPTRTCGLMVSEITYSRNDARSREISGPKRTPASTTAGTNCPCARVYLYLQIHSHQVYTLPEKGWMVCVADSLNLFVSPALSVSQILRTNWRDCGRCIASSNRTSVLCSIFWSFIPGPLQLHQGQKEEEEKKKLWQEDAEPCLRTEYSVYVRVFVGALTGTESVRCAPEGELLKKARSFHSLVATAP